MLELSEFLEVTVELLLSKHIRCEFGFRLGELIIFQTLVLTFFYPHTPKKLGALSVEWQNSTPRLVLLPDRGNAVSTLLWALVESIEAVAFNGHHSQRPLMISQVNKCGITL